MRKYWPTGLLKLQGENTDVFRSEYVNGKPVKGTGKFREELSGSAGRKATDAESVQTISLLADLQQPDLLDEDCRDAATLQKRLTFPEQNAKLLIAFRRAQSFASKLHRWCWFLDPQDEVDRKDQAARRRTAIKEIAESDKHDWLGEDAHAKAKARHAQLGDAKDEPESHPEIINVLKNELDTLIKKLPRWLEAIANRVYHSRSGRLIWRNHPDKPDCHLLDFSLLSKDERKLLTKREMARRAARAFD